MSTLLRNIQLNFAEGEQKVTVGNLTLKNNYINVLNEERFQERGCLFTKGHASLQTHFDLTGAKDCQLLSFDEKFNFVTIRYYKNYRNAPFSYLISEPYVLILPTEHDLPIESTLSLILLEYPEIRGIDHVFGTDAEKVEILATNTHRFYISEYGVWMLPGTKRLKLLDELYQKALTKEDYPLCKRIDDVKEQLKLLPAYQH